MLQRRILSSCRWILAAAGLLLAGGPAWAMPIQVDFTVQAYFSIGSLGGAAPFGADPSHDLHGSFVVDNAVVDDPLAALQSFTLQVGTKLWTEALIDPVHPPPVFPDNFVSFLDSGFVDAFTWKFVDGDASMIVSSFNTFSAAEGVLGMFCNGCVFIAAQTALPEPAWLGSVGLVLIVIGYARARPATVER
jgi:hypothetical protein